MKKRYIYISYEKSFSDVAKNVKNKLLNSGIEAVLSETHPVKESSDKILDKLYAFVFLIPNDKNTIETMEEELKIAVLSGMKIIPIMLDEFELSGAMKLFLSNDQFDYVNRANSEEVEEFIIENIINMTRRKKSVTVTILKEILKILKGRIIGLCKKLKVKFISYSDKTKKGILKNITPGKVGAVWSALVFIFLYIVLEYDGGTSHFNIFLTSMSMLFTGLLFSLIVGCLTKKIKNKIVLALLAAATMFSVFWAMLYIGFWVSQMLI